jgi:hypothetical protein
MKSESDFLFTKEVLEELRISYSTLFRIRRRLNLSPKNGGYKLRYSLEEVRIIKNELQK